MSRLVLTLIVGLLAIANVYAKEYKHHGQHTIYPQLGLSSRESEKLTGVMNQLAAGKDDVRIYPRSHQSEPTFWLAQLPKTALNMVSDIL
ncbi:hypothetical protein N7G274_009544 [Stereocaulon virgatum]|uniref:Uncharacterized protein n=1 Tax=Stereocaulon virgatum TaxID=373712 RepID=A0ABR3ZZ59_9LECA